jgi:hypothetical protein
VKLTVFRSLAAVGVAVVLMCEPGFAQNFGSDARRIALGGTGSNDNIASRLIEDQQDYRAIPIPVGLFQLFNKKEIFDPGDPNFDPVRAIEYAADPMHLTLRRDGPGAGNLLIKDLVNAQLSRDLNTYRGFTPARELHAQGLVSPSFGKTLKIKTNGNGGYQGIYVGAGPYLHIGTAVQFDQQLIDIFSSSTNVYKPNTHFVIGDDTTGQAALAFTGGYRARLSVPGFEASSKEGVFIAANYNYLHGLHYDNGDLNVRFDTDSSGLVTLAPTTQPIVMNRTMSGSGHGFSIDVGTAIVKGGWEFGMGADGIGNRINWTNMTARQYVMLSLTNGFGFISASTLPASASQSISLPVRYHGSAGYRTSHWSAVSEAGKGFRGLDFNGGAEYRFGPLAFRGGGRYTGKLWHGATGLGFNFFKGLGLDIAAFQNTTNLENDHRFSFATSLRIQHREKD